MSYMRVFKILIYKFKLFGFMLHYIFCCVKLVHVISFVVINSKMYEVQLKFNIPITASLLHTTVPYLPYLQ